MRNAATNRKTPVTILAASIAAALAMGPVHAQEAPAPDASQAAQPQDGVKELETVKVVATYRASLEKALDIKRSEKGMVDAIVAEDIGKFPDLNLAESMQRVPGVVITRDGGEGRNISVRGLGPDFTRVRLNGFEALSTVGSTDGAGGTNRGRSFDFNVFASELFSQVIVRKTASADVDEGSLGATVDLRTARPFDYEGFTAVANVQAGYNDLAGSTAPRFAGLISNTSADGRFGGLLSVAYSERKTREEGTGTVRWAEGSTSGGFAGCAAGTAIFPEACDAYAPRFPRYTLMEHDQERLGVTGSLQFKPSDRTTISLDALYSSIKAQRREHYLEANGFSSSGATGKQEIVVLDGEIRDGALLYGQFDDVDLRAESRYDEWNTDFYQVGLEGEHRFTDNFSVSGRVGVSKSKHENPIQATIMMDQLNVDGYSYDYRDDLYQPTFDYGINPLDPAGWNLSVIRMRQNYVSNDYKTGQLDFSWSLAPGFTLRGGIQAKDYGFDSMEYRRGSEGTVPTFGDGTKAMNDGNTVQVGLNGLDGTPSDWLVPDFDGIASLFDIYSGTGLFELAPYTQSQRWVKEKNRGAYLMGEFSFDLGAVPVSGNAGVRYVRTKQSSFGYGTGGTVTAGREYSDTLPSLNLVAEVAPDFLVRLGAAKVMARPGLGSLTPGVTVSVSGSAKSISGGNPMLDPIRANTADLGFEWYFEEGAMLGVGLFYKDIDSFVQTTRETVIFSDTGLPASMLDGLDATTSDEFVLSGPINTPGGVLKGYELNYTQPFTFLPGFWRDFGVQLNYTWVDSEVQYLNKDGSLAQKASLTGLSDTSWNATLYYEGERFSGRVSATNRSDYMIQVPGTESGFNSEAMGVHGQTGTTFVDASLRYKINDHLEISLEGSNLTNVQQESWVANPAVQLPLESSIVGRQYLLGVRYKF